MGEGLRMVHLRTVPDAWHAKVLAARLGSEGIVTQLRGSVSGPYPFGAVSVLVEEAQAELAAELLLADEVEAAFAGNGLSAPPFDQVLADGPSGTGDDGTELTVGHTGPVGPLAHDLRRHGPRPRLPTGKSVAPLAPRRRRGGGTAFGRGAGVGSLR
jgi:hypothetical protein